MNVGEGMAFAGICLSFVGFVYKVTNDEAGKRNRIYARIDEKEKLMDDKKVDTKLCDILHKRTSEDIQEIKSDIKLLLKQNGVS